MGAMAKRETVLSVTDLMKKYGDDYQRATDAYVRGEEGDPDEDAGSENPM